MCWSLAAIAALSCPLETNNSSSPSSLSTPVSSKSASLGGTAYEARRPYRRKAALSWRAKSWKTGRKYFDRWHLGNDGLGWGGRSSKDGEANKRQNAAKHQTPAGRPQETSNRLPAGHQNDEDERQQNDGSWQTPPSMLRHMGGRHKGRAPRPLRRSTQIRSAPLSGKPPSKPM